MGFREKLASKREELAQKHQEEIDREDTPVAFSSIFLRDKFPEWLQIWKPKVGEHLIDILPWVVGKQHPKDPPGSISYQLILWVYQRVGIMNLNFISTASMYQQPDPIFEYMQANRPLPREEWDEKRAKERNVYLIWCRDNDEEEKKGPQLWEVAHFYIGAHLKVHAKQPKGGGAINYSHIDHGQSFSFEIKSDGKYTGSDGKEHDSTTYIGHRFVPRSTSIPDSVVDLIEGIHVDELIKMHPTYEEVYEGFKNKPFGSKEKEREPDKEPESSIDYAEEGICPHGGTMGTDYGQIANCDQCSIWNACKERSEDNPPWEADAGKDAEKVKEEVAQKAEGKRLEAIYLKREAEAEAEAEAAQKAKVVTAVKETDVTPPRPQTRIIKKKIKGAIK